MAYTFSFTGKGRRVGAGLRCGEWAPECLQVKPWRHWQHGGNALCCPHPGTEVDLNSQAGPGQACRVLWGQVVGATLEQGVPLPSKSGHQAAGLRWAGSVSLWPLAWT